MLDELKNAALDVMSSVSDALTNKSELEKAIDEALNRSKSGVPTSKLRDIAMTSNHYDAYLLIMERVWETMNFDSKPPHQVYKALNLLEYLIKFGNERCIRDAKDHTYVLEQLTRASSMENGRDAAAGIREIAKRILVILSDKEMLAAERAKAKQMADKCKGIANTPSHSSYSGMGGGPGSSRNPGFYTSSSYPGSEPQVSSRRSSFGEEFTPEPVGDVLTSRHSERVAVRNGGRKHGPIGSPPPQVSSNRLDDFGNADFDAFGSAVAAPAKDEFDAFQSSSFDAFASPQKPAQTSTFSASTAFDSFDSFDPFSSPTTTSQQPQQQQQQQQHHSGGRVHTAHAPVADAFDSFSTSLAPSHPHGHQGRAHTHVSPSQSARPVVITSPAPTPAPAPAPAMVDPFGSFESAPVTAPAPAPAPVAPLPAFSDPFADPFGSAPPVTTAAAPNTTAANPFQKMGASLTASLGGSASSAPSFGDEFGSFGSAPAAVANGPTPNADVNRLVALDALNAPPSVASSTKNTTPLRAMSSSMPKASVMQSSSTSIPLPLSTQQQPFGGMNMSPQQPFGNVGMTQQPFGNMGMPIQQQQAFGGMGMTQQPFGNMGVPTQQQQTFGGMGMTQQPFGNMGVPTQQQQTFGGMGMGMGMNMGGMGMNMNMGMGMGMSVSQQQPMGMQQQQPFGGMNMGSMSMNLGTPQAGLTLQPGTAPKKAPAANDPFSSFGMF